MGRDDWDLAHEYETHDHPHDDDREWFIEVFSHIVLFLAAIGLITLAPWVLSFVMLVLGLVLGLVGGILGLVLGAIGLVLKFFGLALGLVLKLVGGLLGLFLTPVGLVVVLILLLWRRARSDS